MQQPLKAKTVAKTPCRGPRTRGVPLRYFAIPGTKCKAAYSIDVGDYIEELGAGRVVLDFGADKRLIGVEII